MGKLRTNKKYRKLYNVSPSMGQMALAYRQRCEFFVLVGKISLPIGQGTKLIQRMIEESSRSSSLCRPELPSPDHQTWLGGGKGDHS